MDTKILPKQNEDQASEFKLAGERVHTRGQTETKAPKRSGIERPKSLTWFACQAVRLDPSGKYVEIRSFPFFALSLEHARRELLEATKKDGCPFNRIYQYGSLHQTAGKLSKFQKEATYIDIETGKKL